MFSVIIPVFETPLNFVVEALRSVQEQSWGHGKCEIIIWNDGSDAGYTRALEKELDRFDDLSIRYRVSHGRQGMAHARNSAADLASEEWLLFLDADDFLDPTLFASVASATDLSVDLIYTDHVQVSPDGAREIQSRPKVIYQQLHEAYKHTLNDPMLHATFVFHCQIVRRSSFLEIGGLRTDLGSGDEVDMHLRLAELSSAINVKHIPKFLYYYRDNPLSVTKNKAYYADLIRNISTILAESARRRGFPIESARRIGRCRQTSAAHYELTASNGQPVHVPWFVYPTMSIQSEFIVK